MVTKAPGQKQTGGPLFSGITAFSLWVTKPAAGANPVHLLRIRLLSAFLLLMGIFTLVSSFFIRSIDVALWAVTLAASIALFIGYAISRTLQYRAAMVAAVVIPAMPELAFAIIQPAQIDLMTALMWLAMPLLAAGLMATLKYTHIVSLCYFVSIIVVTILVKIPADVLAILLVFVFFVIFFVIALSALRKKDIADAEKHFTERQKIEEALKESQDKLLKIFNASPDAISITTLDEDGVFLDINASYTRITGYSREEIVNHSAKEFDMFLSDDDYEKMHNNALNKIKLTNEEFRLRTKSGEIRWMLVSTENIVIGNRECLMIVGSDITEYKLTKKALDRSTEQLARVFHLTPQITLLTRLSDGKIIDTNDNFNAVSGYTRDESIGKTTVALRLWGDENDREKFVQAVMENGRVVNEELKFLKKSGEIITGLFSGEPIEFNGEECLVAIFADITEQKRVENALRESEEKFSKAFSASPMAISISDIDEGMFLDVNDSYCRISGYTRNELIKHNAPEYNMWGTLEDRNRAVTRVKSGIPVKNEEMQLRTRQGNLRTLLFSTEYIRVSGKRCLLMVSSDITDYKQAKKSLSEKEQQLSGIFHLSPQQMVIVRQKDGMTIDVNDAHIQVTGYTREESIGRTSTELGLWVDPKDRWKMLDIIKKNGRVYNEEYKIRKKSGEIMTELLSAVPITFDGEPCLVTTITDITVQKRLEKALQESEEKFSKSFHAIPEQISITRVSDGMMLDVNESFRRYRKFTNETPIGHTVYELGLWKDPGARDRMIQAIKEGGSIVNRELSHVVPSGEIQTTLFSADIININGEPCLISISNDITERKRIEQALKESEERFSKTFHAIPESIAISRVSDGKLIDVNDTFCRVAGLPREALIGHTGNELKLRDRPGVRSEIINTIQEQGSIINREITYTADTGKKRATLFSADIIDINGEPCMISISLDITDRKDMEEKLENETVRRRILIEQSRDGIAIVDEKGALYEANRSFAEMLGYAPEETAGLHVWDWETMQGKEQLTENIRNIGEEGANFETQYRRKNGSMIDVEVSTNGALFAGQKLVFSVSRDISERKRMERAIKESEEKFSKAFHASPESITITRVKDGVFLDANESFCESIGRKREDIIGHAGINVNLPEPPVEYYPRIERILKHGRISNEEVITNSAKGPAAMLVSADIVEISGEPCVITISHDITERKRMEQALKESEEKFHKAFHAVPEAIAISKIKNGTFVDVNDQFLRYRPYTRENVIGHTGVELGMWPDQSFRDALIKTITEQGPITAEERDVDIGNGRIQNILFSADIITISGEPCVITISNDITRIKQMEKALRASEEKFSKAFKAIPEAIIITRLDNGQILDVNDAFCRNVGRTREEIIGHIESGTAPIGGPGLHDRIIKTLKENGRIVNDQVPLDPRFPDLGYKLFSAEVVEIGGEQCMIGISTDITELKRIENALRESEEKFSKIFRLSPQQIYITSQPKGEIPRIIDINDSFLRVTGFTRDEVIGKKGEELGIWKTPSDKTKVLSILENQGRIHNEEVEFHLKSGERRTGLLSLEKIDIKGEPCMIHILTDITERKKAEEKLKETLAELEVSAINLKATNKELESFSYSVSHDLRAPLRAVDGFSQALLEDYAPKLDETARDYLNRMRNASQKMGELIDGLLKLSRLTRGEMRREMVDLSAMAKEITARLQETEPERKVRIGIQGRLNAYGDQQMLRVMMENLLGNAWKFTRKTSNARIEFGAELIEGNKTFFIKDNGAGFDMSFKDKLFGAFQRLHSASEFPGTGIGLATVQRIVNRHGGTIRAEAKVDQGASFYFTL